MDLVGKVITRKALYDAVWAQPTSAVCKEFGISDVGLAKACRLVGVPLPPRGYWARKAAGKPVLQASLPPRPPGQDDEVTIGGRGRDWRHYHRHSSEELLGPLPDPPVFDESIESVRRRVEIMVGKTLAPSGLDQPHPIVARLLQKDEERRQQQVKERFPSSLGAPVYDAPIDQRRLRILSSILIDTARCGCRAYSWAGEASWLPRTDFTVAAGDQRVSVRVAASQPKQRQRTRTQIDPKVQQKIRVDLNYNSTRGCGSMAWEDVDDRHGKLLREIAINIVVLGEEMHRRAAQRSYEWRVARKAELINEMKRALDEAERMERERIALLERKRIVRLMAEAESLRKAMAIRQYVAEARSANALLPSPVPDDQLDKWSQWALAQADRIDPVKSLSFLEQHPDK